MTKTNPGLKEVLIGLGWDTNRYDGGSDFDLDSAVFLLGADSKVKSGDDKLVLTGAGAGDDEEIKIDLSKVPAEIEKIAFTVTIYEADTRKQNFGQVENAFIRVFDEQNNKELIRYDLDEDFSIETSVIVGELYRNRGEFFTSNK